MATHIPTLDDDEQEDDKASASYIDVIFLLLIFFILTTKFLPQEKVLDQLLPTEKGQSNVQTDVVEKMDVVVKIYPAGLQRNQQLAHYEQATKRGWSDGVVVSVDGEDLELSPDGDHQGQMELVHGFIKERLTQREIPGPRNEQDPVVIRCYSGLPWRYACWTFDATRAYENHMHAPGITPGSPVRENGREVVMAPPLLRSVERGREKELQLIVNSR